MQKRRIVPDGDTPGKSTAKKVSAVSSISKDLFIESLSEKKMGQKYSWSREEIYHLVEFIALHAERSVSESGWPKHKNSNFWEACAEYVAKMRRKDKRSHSSMRSKVTSYLAINFKKEAEEYFNFDYFSGNPSPDILSKSSPSVQVTTKSINNSSTSHNSFFDSCLSGFGHLPVDMQLKLLDSLFLKYARNLFSDKNILGKFSNDCLSTYMSAVINFHEKGKDNLIHYAAKCLLKRDNGEETRLPIGKMPFGLFDYIVKFFSLPKSNRSSSATRNPYIFDTMKAKVNVPGLSCCTLRNKIQKMDFEKSSVIQDALLNNIAKENPGGRFWIKADWCDVIKGLRESVRHEWAGDTDLGEGALQRLNDIYNKRRDFCCKLGIGARKNVLTTDLGQLLAELDADLSFLDKGVTSSKKIYNDMVDKVSSSKESLFALA